MNFHGPIYVCDAACASAMAAINSATEGLIQSDYDPAVTGGIDRNMGAVEIREVLQDRCAFGDRHSPLRGGSRRLRHGRRRGDLPAKRLADAERDGDKIYAVLRGIAGSSDGKGKGITAPNPVGQKLAVERAWQNAGVAPATAT